MAHAKTVFLVRVNHANLGIYTNLLHAHKHLCRVVPNNDVAKFPSYSTFNRRLRSVGSVMDIQTSIGMASIEHHHLLLRLF